jgi:hypothetical protein
MRLVSSTQQFKKYSGLEGDLVFQKRDVASLSLRFDPVEIPGLTKRYGPKQDDAALAAGQRIGGGEYTRKNLNEIFEWKTKGRGRSRLLRNSDREIADALALAVKAQTERVAIAVLIGLHGVNVPVASAILTAIDPDRYTVIDFRALQALGSNTRDRSINFYLDYLAVCRQLAKKHRATLRDLDRALWQWSDEHRGDNDFDPNLCNG